MDLFTKYGAHGFDDTGLHLAWVDDSVLPHVDSVLPASWFRWCCSRVGRRHGLYVCQREGSRHAQGELPACLDRHTWSCLRDKDLKFDKQSQFVLDECDKCLDILDGKTCDKSSSRRPKKRQVMMFSATMTSETRGLCKKFISDTHEIRVDEESKLTLLSKLTEREKN